MNVGGDRGFLSPIIAGITFMRWGESSLSLSPLDKHRSINTNSLITGRLSERERVSNRHLPRFHGREQIFRGIEPVEARYFARITAKRPHIDRNSRDCASERLFQNPDDFNFTGLYLSSDGLFLSLSFSSFLGRKNGINRRAEWRIYDFCSFISSFFFFRWLSRKFLLRGNFYFALFRCLAECIVGRIWKVEPETRVDY